MADKKEVLKSAKAKHKEAEKEVARLKKEQGKFAGWIEKAEAKAKKLGEKVAKLEGK